MASPSFQAPIGTHDVLPPESRRWEALVSAFAELAGRAGYGLVLSPMFEDIDVFHRIGEATDIVTKEMYDFTDKGDRHLALRPEGTASVVRAWIQHRPPTPFKAWYVAPSFRYERPQAGRYRQHHQVGVEVIGPQDPDVDVEVIALAWAVMRSLGLEQLRLLVNSLGDADSRAAYRQALVDHVDPHRDDLGDADRRRLHQNPLRLLDSKDPATQALVADAPAVADLLNKPSQEHLARVEDGLSALGIPFARDARLVRGLDYYSHTLFEIEAPALEGTQKAVGGGGRYDGLAEQLGGPSTPGMGFGLGIERLLLACDAEGVFGPPPDPVQVFVIDTTDGTTARDLTHELRAAGVGADRAWGGRSMKAQFKAADRSPARYAVVVGDDERARGTVSVTDLRRDGEQVDVARPDLVTWLTEALAR